jgi:Gp157 protein
MAKIARAASVPPPSPNALHRATLTLRDMRERLIAIDPTIIEDIELFTDTLDGETDALDVLADMVRAAIDAETMCEAIKARKADLDQRSARFARRQDALRRGVLEVMQDIGLPKLEREDFTASISAGRQGVRITDEKALTDQYVRVTREPNKIAIGDDLKAGKTVPGAVLSNPEPGLRVLSVRTR